MDWAGLHNRSEEDLESLGEEDSGGQLVPRKGWNSAVQTRSEWYPTCLVFVKVEVPSRSRRFERLVLKLWISSIELCIFSRGSVGMKLNVLVRANYCTFRIC